MNKTNHNIKGSLAPLLEETPVAYYWIGFLMADGHFSKKNCLQIALSKRDYSHLVSLGTYLRFTGKYNRGKVADRLAIMDTKNIDLLRTKFEITNTKTIHPCNIKSILRDDLFMSLVAGMIDGDGSIRSNKRKVVGLSMKMHSSWLSNMTYMCQRVYHILNKKCYSWPRLNANGYALWTLTDFESVKELRRYIESLGLPIMQRKWNRIDLEHKTHYERGRETATKVRNLYTSGIRQKDIAKQLNISSSMVSMILSGRRGGGLKCRCLLQPTCSALRT